MDDYPAADPIPEPDIYFQYGELMSFLNESQSMRRTARNAVKQSLWAGGGALGGAFLMGPIGGLVGGIFGSIVGFVKSDEYDGALLAIMKLEGARREVLMREVGQVLMAAGATTRDLQSAEAFRGALYSYAEQETVRNGVWRACLHSIQDL
jgi:hypothetical protein